MEQKHQGENQRLIQKELSMPRFDDEATVLHARQVVPLIEVRRESRWRRRLLAFAGLIALLGGTIYGRLFYGPPVEKDAQVNETLPPISGHVPHDAAQPGEAGGSAQEKSVSTSDENPDVQEFDRETPPVSERSAGPEVTNYTNRRSDGQNDVGDGEIPRAERTSARPKLREERKVRRQKVRNSDDLFRIQELFEGQQKPQPN